jgi:signal peptidase
VLALAVAVALVPALTSGKALNVVSDSMRPTFKAGDLVIVKGVKPGAALNNDDIITYLPNPDSPAMVTHRIVGKGEDAATGTFYITRGDNSATSDEPVHPDQIRGKFMYKIPYLGKITQWAANNPILAVLGAGALLAAWVAVAVIVPKRLNDPRRRTPGRAGTRSRDEDEERVPAWLLRAEREHALATMPDTSPPTRTLPRISNPNAADAGPTRRSVTRTSAMAPEARPPQYREPVRATASAPTTRTAQGEVPLSRAAIRAQREAEAAAQEARNAR